MYLSAIHSTFSVTQFVIEEHILEQNNKKKKEGMDSKKAKIVEKEKGKTYSPISVS